MSKTTQQVMVFKIDLEIPMLATASVEIEETSRLSALAKAYTLAEAGDLNFEWDAPDLKKSLVVAANPIKFKRPQRAD